MGISRYSRPVRPLVPCAMPGVPPRTNSGSAASAPVTSGRLRSAIRTTTSMTRRTTRTKETPQLLPRRLRDRDDRTPRQRGVTCGDAGTESATEPTGLRQGPMTGPVVPCLPITSTAWRKKESLLCQAFLGSPVKVIRPLSFCYTTGLLHRRSGGGHHAGQSVRTFCGEKSHFRDGAGHAGTRPRRGPTRCLVCPDSAEAVHPHRVVFDRL